MLRSAPLKRRARRSSRAEAARAAGGGADAVAAAREYIALLEVRAYEQEQEIVALRRELKLGPSGRQSGGAAEPPQELRKKQTEAVRARVLGASPGSHMARMLNGAAAQPSRV